MNKFDYLKGVFGSELKPRARLVLQCLIFHANKEGFCFPSIKTIAAECGYCLSTVKRALNELYNAGYVERTVRFDDRKNGGQTSNIYSLIEVEQPTSAVPEPMDAEPTEKPQVTEVPPRDTHTVYTYSFSEGLKKLLTQSSRREEKAAAKTRWTGGQSKFIPP